MTSLARTCYRWRFAVLAGWVVALVALAAVALGAGSAFTDSADLPDSESATAYRLLAEAGPASAGGTRSGTIVWRTAGVPVTDVSVRTEITAMLAEISALPGVEAVLGPYDKAGAAQLNAGADTAYATVVVDGNAEVAPMINAADRHDGASLDVETGGTAFTEQPGGSHGAEGIGILAALVIMLLMFRSGWAAFLPVLTGVVGVAASLLVVVLGAHVIKLSGTSLTMGALIGLGVGIDYALFIVNRHRKALLAGSPVPDAIGQALNTSGRAVVFAGATVIVALLGMVVVGLGVLTGMGRAAAVTVLFTVAAAITLLPALLGVLGHRVLSRRQRAALAAGPGTGAAAGRHRTGPAARWAVLLQRAPVRAGTLALLAVAVLATPVLSMRVGDADAGSDPRNSSTHAYFAMMARGFGDGFDASLLLVARTPDATAARAFTVLVDGLSTAEGVASVTTAPAAAGRRIAVATVVPAGSAQTEQTADLVTGLRNDLIPGAERGTTLDVSVGGATATSLDLSDALMSKLPRYLGLVAVLGFLLLAVAFRSILVPLAGALSNIATILVGLGVITAIFQFGWGSELLRVGTGAPVMYLVPVIIVGVMFGLSMDYQVFLVSRMHEEWRHTRDNRRAVRVGLAETAQVIGAAATIMLCVFASFGFSGERIVSAIGIGLAIAVVVDAFVVRLTLIPALMTIIGRHNWSYPRLLGRVTPALSIDGPATPVTPEPEGPAARVPVTVAETGATAPGQAKE